MKYPTADTVALLLAVLLHRSGKSRARISEKTLKNLSGRTRCLRDAFIAEVQGWAEEYGVIMVRLQRGGFALMSIEALEGAPAVMAKTFLADEHAQLKQGSLDTEALLEELGFGEESEDE